MVIVCHWHVYICTQANIRHSCWAEAPSLINLMAYLDVKHHKRGTWEANFGRFYQSLFWGKRLRRNVWFHSVHHRACPADSWFVINLMHSQCIAPWLQSCRWAKPLSLPLFFPKPVCEQTNKVTWCFTPSQPVRLYQGENKQTKSGKNGSLIRFSVF